MLRNGFNLGGEQSGHMIFRDYGTTGDGLVAALQLLRIMKMRDMTLSKLAKCWTRFPQLVTNIRVREKKPFEELNGLDDPRHRSRNRIEITRWPPAPPLFRHRTQSPPPPRRQRQSRPRQMERENLDAIKKQVGE